MQIPLLDNLKSLRNSMIVLGSAVLVFDLYYYVMTTFPGSAGKMCVLGANFTPLNVIFSLILAVMSGIMIAAIIELAERRKLALVGSSASSVGIFFGTMTVFCTFCTLPVISLFGLSISLTFFTDYEIAFKGLSIILMGVGLYLLDRQLAKQCGICKN